MSYGDDLYRQWNDSGVWLHEQRDTMCERCFPDLLKWDMDKWWRCMWLHRSESRRYL